jgi:hypothetical protein
MPTSTSTDIATIIYKSLIVVGIIIILATIGSASSVNLKGTIVGYGFIGFGILILIATTMMMVQGVGPSSNMFNIINILGPFLFILGAIGYTMYLLIVHFNRISDGNISSGYVNFSNVSLMLMMLQLYIFYLGTNTKEYLEKKSFSKIYSSLLYLIGFLNIIAVITIGIILTYFTTDG